MTATILLIRHAAHAHLGHILSGRTAGGSLTAEGREQARALARHLSGEPIVEVHSSPVTRARETAQAVAEPHGVAVTVAEALDEVDFGSWTGRSFDELAGDPRWRHWNDNRAQACAPSGETMTQVQRRATEYLTSISRRMAGRVVAIVSHCDVVRAVIAGILGLSLDHLLRFDIAPASISRVQAGDWGERVLSLNEVAA